MTEARRDEARSDIRELTPGLWVVDHPLSMPGGIQIGTRTTIVRLESGGLWVHSPGPLSPAISSWLEENGSVEAIVAPNLLHHMFVAEMAKGFPTATVHAPASLSSKRGIAFASRPIDPKDPVWKGDFECLQVGGCPRMDEFVFLHRRTRTLIITDLAFNFRTVDSFGTRLFLRINGVLGRFAPSRLARSYYFQDRSALRRSIQQILDWDFDRVILAHGDVLETGGVDAMRQAYRWLLDGAKPGN